MDSSEIKQLQILAARSRMGAILGTYHAKSGHPPPNGFYKYAFTKV